MLQIVDLPKEVFFKILSCLSFHEISKLREVNTYFNDLCMTTLNDGFHKAEAFRNTISKEVKDKLPRRESERRSHELSRHSDILSAIETRMSLLQITYLKYIDAGYCCFIPGKVLDELMSVLRYVKTATNPPRAHEVLMELRDISSMAMEHFDEKILPPLRKQLTDEGITVLPGGLTVGLDPEFSLKSSDLLLKRTSVSPAPYSPARKKRRFSSMNEAATSQSGQCIEDRLDEAERIIAQQGETIEEQSKALADLNRRLSDYNTRFSDLTEVLKLHFNTDNVNQRLTEIMNRPESAMAAAALSSPSDKSYTRIVTPKGKSKALCRINLDSNNSMKRAEKLKEKMDRFRDELKLS